MIVSPGLFLINFWNNQEKIIIKFISSYSGVDCSQLVCAAAEPPACRTYSTSYCSIGVIGSFCPKLCKKCKCEPFACLNNGQFNNGTCGCDCFPK